MRRRALLKVFVSSAITWPLVGRAQSAMPSIGFLGVGSLRPFAQTVAAFQRGLKDAGYAEGRGVAIEYRWAEGKNERLPELAAELVGRRVSVIAALADVAIAAAKAATTTIPVVFMTGGDPVKNGFVKSFSRPGGNITGATWFSSDPMAKRIEILHEIVPGAAVVGQLVDLNFGDSVSHLAEVKEGARALGLQLVVEGSRTPKDLDTAFANLLQRGARAIAVGPGGLHFSQRERIVGLATRHAIPTIYPFREFAVDGGLISYGNKLQDSFYWAGDYVGRILKGANPANLPVIQSTRFELVINRGRAKALGLEMPSVVLAATDEMVD